MPDVTGDGISELVVDENLCVAAVGFDAEFDEFGKVDAKIGEVFSFSRGIEIGKVEVHSGYATFCAEGNPDGGAFAEEVDAGLLAGGGTFGVVISNRGFKGKMVGVDLTEVADIGEHDGGGGWLHRDILFADLVDGQADPAIVDGFFLFKIDGYGVLFDQREPAVGLDKQVMGFHDLVANLQGGVIEVGVVVDGGILMAALWHFHAAGRVPGLLNDDGVVGAAAGIIVEYDGVGEAGGDCLLAAEGIILGLRWWLLAVEEEEDGQDEDKDGCTEPDTPELAMPGWGGVCGVVVRGAGFAVDAVQPGFRWVLGAFGRISCSFGRILGNFRMRLRRRMFGGQIAPIVITEELGEGIEGMGIWEAVVLDFSPNAFEGNMANGYPGLVADQFA